MYFQLVETKCFQPRVNLMVNLHRLTAERREPSALARADSLAAAL